MSHWQVFRAIEALCWKPVTVFDVAVVAEMEVENARKLVHRMRDYGLVKNAGYGQSRGPIKPQLFVWIGPAR
jgi:hypothetical protein